MEAFSALILAITKFGSFMAIASLLAIPLALFTDTSTGDNAYRVSDPLFAWTFFTVLFVLFGRKYR